MTDIFKHKQRNDRHSCINGFLLYELIVILMMASISAALVIPATGQKDKDALIQICADNLSDGLTMTTLYATDNQGYATPIGQTSNVFLTYTMGMAKFNSSYTDFPVNMGALYEYFDITSDAALCPLQASILGKTNAHGEQTHPNYIAAKWSEKYYISLRTTEWLDPTSTL